MFGKIVFIGEHYLVLAACIAACWGLGQTVLPQDARRSLLGALLALCVGMGIFICGLQAMLVAGLMKPVGVWSLLALGLAAALVHIIRIRPRPLQAWGAWWATLSFLERGGVLLALLFFASTLIVPMVPPAGSDAAMYHLPHAREWAATGGLGYHEWLRYPWFPFNLDLPFAPALLLYDDIFAQLLAAMPGWVCAGLLFLVALRFTGLTGASLATIFWLQAGRDHYAYAGVDLTVSLFIFGAYVACLQARASEARAGWIVASAFLLGVACGGKYQALSFVPLGLLGLWWTDRRPRTIAIAALAFLLPCGYWYARNAIMTGDPFQPMGGKIFGFSDWNLQDYQLQFADLKNHANWPIWYLWPLLLAPISSAWRKASGVRVAFALCAYAFAVWLVTSHYARYLLPAYPLMAILSVLGWGVLITPVLRRLPLSGRPGVQKNLRRLGWLVLVVLTPLLGMAWAKGFANVSPTQAARDTYLRGRVASYEALGFVQTIPTARIYQAGLDDAVYFSRKPMYGDVFGPWRYADFLNLPAPEFAAKLRANGFDTFILRTTATPGTEQHPDFRRHFDPIFSRNGVVVYRVLPATP
jgi:hypothetical protein